MPTTTTNKGKHSPPGKGNIYAKANEVIVKITGGDTNQTFEVVEENCKPGFQSRAHYHIKAFETFYLFDGSADFQVGDELFHAIKGSCVHIPPGVPHQVTSKEGVRMLMIYSNMPGILLFGPIVTTIGYAPTVVAYCVFGLACTLLIVLAWREHLWRAGAQTNAR